MKWQDIHGNPPRVVADRFTTTRGGLFSFDNPLVPRYGESIHYNARAEVGGCLIATPPWCQAIHHNVRRMIVLSVSLHLAL